MQLGRIETRTGIAAVETLTTLLQRVRNAHPTDGMYQAAEVQHWWTAARSTDSFEQLFWFDDDDVPVAAVTVTDFGAAASLVYGEPMLVVTVMPDAPPAWVDQVVEHGLDHLAAGGITAVEIEVASDGVIVDPLRRRGFVEKEPAVVECWLDAADRPPVTELADGYRLAARSDTGGQPHHMAGPRRPGYEQRLQELSLYRPDLDLVVFDSDDAVAAYGLFWFDPVTDTGVVEPMRTHDEHQQRGLGRHILTNGIERLARAGATKISIGYEPDNPASGHLYTDVGFTPVRQTDLFAGSTRRDAAPG